MFGPIKIRVGEVKLLTPVFEYLFNSRNSWRPLLKKYINIYLKFLMVKLIDNNIYE